MLHFQLAGADSGYLLEHLLIESIGARRGGGIFAWANASGAKTLIDDPTFVEFLEAGNFRLFIGLDSITDVAAIEALQSLSSRHFRLDVRAYINSSNGLFHPKMAWFELDNYLSLIVGSGNLTMGGLKSNWEAFTVTHVHGKEAQTTLDEIEGWLTDRGPDLLPLSDPRVLERAAENAGSERNLKHAPAKRPMPTVLSETETVLVAEIPRAGTRWSQANFDLEHYEGFFGAAVGTQRRIVLYNVYDDGRLGAVESRPSVEVVSQNYRFELAAAKGKAYPTSGRPIGVFVRLKTGEFLYSLLLPGDAGHADLENFLNSRWTGRGDRMRRVTVPVNDVRTAWPSAPLWEAKLPAL